MNQIQGRVGGRVQSLSRVLLSSFYQFMSSILFYQIPNKYLPEDIISNKKMLSWLGVLKGTVHFLSI